MIRTVALRKRYGASIAVDGVSLDVRAGEIYGFLGPNGAGKTTTISMLTGVTRPTSGEIYLFGERAAPGRLDLRRRVGVVPERHPLAGLAWMSAGEYLAQFADLYRVSGAAAAIARLLERVGLASERNKRIGQLSAGMLQKLSIVRALLPDPDLLILDEPISQLDPHGIKEIRDLIVEENREGRAILISSHQLSEVERICGRVGILLHGRLVVEDSMESLLASFAAEREICIELAALPAELPARIGSRLPFIRGSRAEGRQLIVAVPREGDFRRAISEQLISMDLVPVRIQERTISLEEVFVSIASGRTPPEVA